MDRKQIIAKEIEFWKKNRLLPEHYCDFLLMLYRGENGENHSKKKGNFFTLTALIISIVCLTLFGISFVAFYFTDFSPIMQILIFALSFIVISVSVWYLGRSRLAIVHLLNMVLALFIFISLIQIIETIYPHSPIAIFSVVLVNCIGWIYLGYKYKLKYFLVSGAIGIGMVIIVPFFI